MREAESRFAIAAHLASGTRRSHVLAALLISLIAALTVALPAGTASAAFLHEGSSTGFFGADGTEATSFTYLEGGGLAIDQAGRRLYAVETRVPNPDTAREDVKIYAYDLENSHAPIGGNFPLRMPEGQYGEIAGVMAVDNSSMPSAGNLYYLEKNNSYESRPSFLWGFDSDGNPLEGEFPIELQPPLDGCGVAVDSEGHIWTGDQVSHSLREYSAAGVPLAGQIKLDPKQDNSFCYFAFNLSNDDVYVDGRMINEGSLFRYTAASNYTNATEIAPGTVGSGAQPVFDTGHQMLYANGRAFNPDGTILATGPYSGQLALDETTGTLYTNPGINIYSPSVIPDASTGGVEGTTVEATVDPLTGGDVTECSFEYGTTPTGPETGYPSSIACDQALPYSSSKSVTATLPGLTPEVRYHYRVKAGNATGSYMAAERSFVPHHVQDLRTDAASAVTKTSATLNGGYTGTGVDTHYYFEWGTTNSYGNTTAVPPGMDDGIKSGPQPLNAPLAGLAADTVYHYRVVASNSEGISAGEDRSFETAHAVSGLAASFKDLTGSTVTLEADWTGNGADTHYYFDWGATTAYGHQTEVPPGADAGSGVGPQHFEVGLSELLPLHRYHFRLVASNIDGTTITSDVTFRTPQLAAVSYEPVQEMTPTSAVLVGTINPRKTGPTTYHFDWGLDTGYGNSTSETGPVGADDSIYPASAKIEGLAPGTVYHYRLVATSPTGSAFGPDKKFTSIPNLPTVTESAMSDLAVGGAVLHATVRPGFAPTVVYFQYGTGTSYGLTTVPDSPLPADDAEHGISTALDGLAPGTTYHFRAVAINLAGVDYGSDETFETPGLPVVGSTSASSISRTGASLAGLVDPSLAPTTYRFEYGTTADYGIGTADIGPIGPDAIFHHANADIQGLVPGTTYHFRLVASNALGRGVSSDQTFTTLPAEQHGETQKPKVDCKKGQVKKDGKCVKKRRKHRKHHKRRNG